MPAKNNGTEWKANEQYWRSTVRFWYDVQNEINLFLWMVKKNLSCKWKGKQRFFGFKKIS